jgi:hypothetical protein
MFSDNSDIDTKSTVIPFNKISEQKELLKAQESISVTLPSNGTDLSPLSENAETKEKGFVKYIIIPLILSNLD